MNNVTLVGRLVKDAELRTSTSGTATAKFTLAVDRRFTDANGQRQADFISCVAFGKTAEFLDKYFQQGMKLGIIGRIQTGSYTNKDGAKVYTTDVVADNVEFIESKKQETAAAEQTTNHMDAAVANEGFMQIDDSDCDDGLPFK